MSNAQIAQELGLCASDSQRMAEQLRQGVVMRKPPVQLAGEVECDEVYVVAGHKGIPSAIKNRDPRRNRLKGARHVGNGKATCFWHGSAGRTSAYGHAA
ncbi:hypothetical protein BCS42_00160 [Crenothrix sp. D3]|nr:hypothetical protein BCS42_00160 [Crenothrix sp. D3]